MFDFPASPTNGQTFTPPGSTITYVWNGTVWLVQGAPGFPPGQVGWFATAAAPSGWIKANGALLSRTTYAALFTAIGTTFGVGDGTTTFALPDLRGEFVRALDDGRGIDAARALGSAQGDVIETHTHTWSGTTAGENVGHTHYNDITSGYISADHSHAFSPAVPVANQTTGGTRAFSAGTGYPGTGIGGVTVNHQHAVQGSSGGISVGHTHTHSGTTAAQTGAGTETRPRNVALLACIRY